MLTEKTSSPPQRASSVETSVLSPAEQQSHANWLNLKYSVKVLHDMAASRGLALFVTFEGASPNSPLATLDATLRDQYPPQSLMKNIRERTGPVPLAVKRNFERHVAELDDAICIRLQEVERKMRQAADVAGEEGASEPPEAKEARRAAAAQQVSQELENISMHHFRSPPDIGKALILNFQGSGRGAGR